MGFLDSGDVFWRAGMWNGMRVAGIECAAGRLRSEWFLYVKKFRGPAAAIHHNNAQSVFPHGATYDTR